MFMTSTRDAGATSLQSAQQQALLLCRLLTCCVFLGRAYQHLRWDAPFRAVLWKRSWAEPIVTGIFDIPWTTWLTDLSVDAGIQTLIRVHGSIYLVCAILVVLQLRQLWAQIVLGFGGCLLFLLAALYTVENHYRLGQFVEYSLQFGAPFFYIAMLRGWTLKPIFIHGVKVAIALTFIGHGMYAMGYYPVPGHFVTMSMETLGLSEPHARMYLSIAGYLDFLVAILIFVPKLERPTLIYAAIWGTLTALARIVAGFEINFPVTWLDLWAHQSLFRLVHGGMPIVLLILLRQKQQ